MLTAEHHKWVHLAFGVDPIVYSPAAPADGASPAAADRDAAPQPPAADMHTESLVSAISPSDIPDPRINATVRIINTTKFALKLASSSLENPKMASFDSGPPDEIAANDEGEIALSNNFPYVGFGVGGTCSYNIVGDENNAVLVLKWERGFLPKRTATAKISPANPSKYDHSADFKLDEFTFRLKPAGGDKPDPNQPPNPTPTPVADANASCQITVTNNTKSVLTLAHQGHDYGDFMSFPAASIQPGSASSFISTHTPHAKDGQQGCKGFATWEVADPAGDGKAAATWRVDWQNPVGDKNTATATLDPQGAGFSSLEQIGQGDENVPTAFTISGGGGGANPQPVPQAGATSCDISISNMTNFTLELLSQTRTNGDFVAKPGKRIAPNGEITCSDSGEQGCAGTLVYQIMPPDTGADPSTPLGTWTLDWGNPPGDANEVSTQVTPANGSFSPLSSVGSGDAKVAVSFTLLSNTAPPTPQATGTSCIITVTNNTDATLKLAGISPEKGKLDGPAPANTLAPGAATSFTMSGPDGCKGTLFGSLVAADAAAPPLASVKMNWDNPPGEGNSAVGNIDPASSGYAVAANFDSGDEKVLVTFELSGHAPDKPKPNGRPPGEKEPTLRKGDKSPDGWVEFLQEQLGLHGHTVAIDGDFGGGTERAVKAFQADMKKKDPSFVVDGVVGNQTWAGLRDHTPAPPSTDGRKPHTFEDHGKKARWWTEDRTCLMVGDDLVMRVYSVGDEDITGGSADIDITPPGATGPTSIKGQIGPRIKAPKPDDEGARHEITIKSLRQSFPPVPPAKPDAPFSDYKIEAWLDSSLSGDHFSGGISGS